MFKNSQAVWFVAACLGLTGGAMGCGDDDAGDPCPTGGVGSVAVTYLGLPAGLDGPLTLTSGASVETLTAPETVTGLAAGTWTVVAAQATQPDPRIRTVYSSGSATFCVRSGATTDVEVTWAPVPTSHRLWSSNGSGGTGDLQSFVSEDLAASGSVVPQSFNGPTGRAIAFERNGDFWAFGASTSDAQLGHFDAYSLSASAEPNAEVNIAGVDCIPALNALTLGPDGDLWVSSSCAMRVVRLDAAAIAIGGTITPTTTLTGDVPPAGLAFDSGGNLWVSYDDSTVRRFDASSLAGSTSTAARTVTIKASADPTDTATIIVGELAFDAAGNLWGGDFRGNSFVRLAAAALPGTGEADVVASVRVTVPLRALLQGFAFDEAGGLWHSYGAGQLARLAPTQLGTSSGPGSPTTPATIIESTDIGYLGSVAIYPAPAALPLFHALP